MGSIYLSISPKRTRHHNRPGVTYLLLYRVLYSIHSSHSVTHRSLVHMRNEISSVSLTAVPTAPSAGEVTAVPKFRAVAQINCVVEESNACVFYLFIYLLNVECSSCSGWKLHQNLHREGTREHQTSGPVCVRRFR